MGSIAFIVHFSRRLQKACIQRCGGASPGDGLCRIGALVAFMLVGASTPLLAGQSLGGQPQFPSMFADNGPVAGGAFGDAVDDDDSVSIGHDRVVGPSDVVKDAVVMGADLTIYGTVTGDAVCIGGNLTVGPGAVVKGDLVNVGGTLTVDPSATTYKDRVNIGGFPFGFLKGMRHLGGEGAGDNGWFGLRNNLGRSGFAAKLLRFATDVVYLLLLLFFALLLTTFMPRQFDRIEAHLVHEFPRSLLLGIASMAGVPIVLLAFVISVVGILFIPFFLLALVISSLMGYAVFCRMLGRRLLPARPVMFQVMGGLLLLHAAFLIGDVLLLPGGAFYGVLGHLFRGVGRVFFFCANFIGLGAVFYSLWGKRELVTVAAEKAETLTGAADDGSSHS